MADSTRALPESEALKGGSWRLGNSVGVRDDPTIASVLRLQQQAGNQAVQRLVSLQRFTTTVNYDFAKSKRARLPPSLELRDLGSGMERHHIIGDRKILVFLGTKAKNQVVEINEWATAALEAEINRARPLVAKEKSGNEYSADTTGDTKRKIDRIGAIVESELVPLHASFASSSDEAEPRLGRDEIENLLPVLEWMPPNLLLGIEARKFDPGDRVDIEALIAKEGDKNRKLLLKLAVAMGHVSPAHLKAIAGKHEDDSEAKQQWQNLADRWKKDDSRVSHLFAKLVKEGDLGDRRDYEIAASETGDKEKLETEPDWEAFLIKAFSAHKKP